MDNDPSIAVTCPRCRRTHPFEFQDLLASRAVPIRFTCWVEYGGCGTELLVRLPPVPEGSFADYSEAPVMAEVLDVTG